MNTLKRITIGLAIILIAVSMSGISTQAANKPLSTQNCGTGWARTAYPTYTYFQQTSYGLLTSYTMHDITSMLADIAYAKERKKSLGKTELEYLLDGEYEPAAYYLMLDYGYFTEYVDEFKQKGWIDPAYQLPTSYYKTLSSSDYKTYSGDCPIVDTFNANMAISYEQARKTGNSYVPKFILDGQSAAQNINAAAVSDAEPLKSYAGNTEEFNAYMYYTSNPDLQTAIGADGIALYNHWLQFGKAEGRIAK